MRERFGQCRSHTYTFASGDIGRFANGQAGHPPETLTGQPGLSEYLLTTGGVTDPTRIIYGDLTGSGAEEAVVPVSSGGEGGDIAVFVFGYIDGEIAELLKAEPAETSIVASIQGGQLMTTEGIFAPGDPMNFPSQLLHRYYAWDGAAFVVDREEQEDAR
ncbi:MAG: hypothetical protein V3S20_10525 [Dehalococcoidia bacterium]